ncbi:MAG TPA: branched-chain amino acid ABC transporter permease [Myxococcaceae bacterium]|nr:branched-chain amino acid ABC transporter permease [Myxococcaceae bacterium]
MAFFVEVLVGGLLAGVMYSLVALGFVLIFKASGVFNFAQGAMVLAAATTYAGLVDRGWSGWAAFLAALGVMILFALATERFVLRPLVNQPQISLFMATIGLTFVLEGLSQAVWGSVVRGLDLGIPDTPLEVKGVLISKFDLVASATAGGLVVTLALFFQKTRVGRALRAVADDHQAALSVGIPLERIWAVVWAAAGAVALVTGLLWGSRLGVQFALTQIALKALPVIILGGFTSIAGAIVGGLMVGASEKVAEVYLGPIIGGGIENWFPYLLALLFLLVRPDGLFGEKRIERV